MSGTFLDLSFSDDENINDQLNLSDLVFSDNDSDNNGGLSDIETRDDPTFSSAPENPMVWLHTKVCSKQGRWKWVRKVRIQYLAM